MNLADEHLLKALVLTPELVDLVQDNDDLKSYPKSKVFCEIHHKIYMTLPGSQMPRSYEIAETLMKRGIAAKEHGTESVRLANQILNIMRSNGRRVP
jgi:hypothetical protein